MNWVIILGLIFIFIGTGLTYYGGSIEAKRSAVINQKAVSEKIDDAMSEIKEIQEGPLSVDKKEEVKKVEDEFATWANDFVVNIDQEKVEYAKSVLDRDSLALSLNQEWRPRFEYFLNTLAQLITAYNGKATIKIDCTIPPLPKNIFSDESEKFEATVKFSDSIAWKITLTSVRHVTDVSIPDIKLGILDEEYFGTKYSIDTLILYFRPKENESRIVFLGSTIPPIAEYDDSCNMDDYEQWIKGLLTTMLEYYIIRLS